MTKRTIAEFASRIWRRADVEGSNWEENMNSVVWTNGTALMRPRPAKTITWGTDKAQMRPRSAKTILWGS
jgi:hypothetical protein